MTWKIVRTLAVASLTVSVLAAPPRSVPPDKNEVGAWVARLGDADFAKREEAERALLAIGETRPDEVLGALPEASPDPEIERRCDRLRRRIPWDMLRKKAEQTFPEALEPEAPEPVSPLFSVPDAPSLHRTVQELFADPCLESLSRLLETATRLDDEERISRTDPWAVYGMYLLSDLLPHGALDRKRPPPSPLLEKALPIAAEFLKYPEPRVRAGALTVLGAHQARLSPGIRKEIVSLLQDSESGVRAAAVRSLAIQSYYQRILPKERHRETLKALWPCGEDPAPEVRKAVFEVLPEFIAADVPGLSAEALAARVRKESDPAAQAAGVICLRSLELRRQEHRPR